VLASRHLGRQAGFCIVVSSGTLLAAIGFGQGALTAGALYYLLSSTLAASALFLLFELIERARLTQTPVPDDEVEPPPFSLEQPEARRLIDDEYEEALTGKVIPAAMAFIGLAFVLSALVLAGLPPMSGFLGKFAMLSALLNPLGLGVEAPVPIVSAAGWSLVALIIGSGFLSTLGLSQTGIRYFWAPHERPIPKLRVIECAPIAALLLACVVLTVRADPVMRYARAAAQSLHQPQAYIDAIMRTAPVSCPASVAVPAKAPDAGGAGSVRP
jgi:multicomponent K+:H+ antiporter subunit D